MKKYIVGAYRDGQLHHFASGHYDMPESAEAYCDDCSRLCSPLTGLTYKVSEVDV